MNTSHNYTLAEIETIRENDKRDKELADLRATNAELLAACKKAVKLAGTYHRRPEMISDLKQAIANAEREGNK